MTEQPGAWTLFGRFWTRVFLDDEGAPALVLFLLLGWTIYLGDLLNREPAPSIAIAQLATAVEFLLILWAAALKLGASIFVPVAEIVASVLGRVAATGAAVVEAAAGKLTRTAYQPPDRNVPLAEAELSRPAGSQKVP